MILYSKHIFLSSSIILILFFSSKPVTGQISENFEDTWLTEHPGLKVGDHMPTLSLGDIVNNQTGNQNFSDFKGKLIILDFWNTSCTSCILFFPKMEALQKTYGDKIQILLVNTYETHEEIRTRMKMRKDTTKYKLPNLPSIANASELFKLFPHRYVPHHVWIDGNGIIRIIGPSINTYSEKIETLLLNKEVSYVNGENTHPAFNSSLSYLKVLGHSVNPRAYNSVITPYNTVYAPTTGGVAFNQIDSLNKTRRNTWVNTSVWELYLDAYPSIKRDLQKVIFSTYPLNSLFFVTDTTKYTDEFISRESTHFEMTDLIFSKSRVCYEQISPISYSDATLMDSMRNDLNNYFESKYGTKVTLQKKIIKCWILIRKQKGSNKQHKSSYDEKMTYYTNTNLKELVRSYIMRSHIKDEINQENIPFHFLNETGVGSPINIALPQRDQVLNLEMLRKHLNVYNFDIIQRDREITFLVFKEMNN